MALPAKLVAEPTPHPKPDAMTLRRAVTDLERIFPWPGLAKSVLSLVVMGLLITMALRTQTWGELLFWALVTAVFYSSIFLLTHDAIHHTLTGWKWFDELFPRVLAYPMLWYHGIYCALHKIHHKMNGNDIDDPERPQYTEEEYRAAGPVKRWLIRNQWWLNCFVWGGFGFLFKHYWQAYLFYNKSREVRLNVWTDLAGVIVVQGAINYWALSTGNWLKAFTFFIVLERVMGCFHQMRSHIEHYGLWGRADNPYETQLRNSRNIRTNGAVSFYMDHLNYHSVHHAFPRIPFYRLKEAHERLQRLLSAAGAPLVEDTSYFRTALRLGLNPVVIRGTGREATPPTILPISELDRA